MFEHLTTNGPYSEATAAGFMRELAAALCFLHSNDIIHADLKPENLMLSSWDLGESKLKVRQYRLVFGFGFGLVLAWFWLGFGLVHLRKKRRQ